MGLETVETEIVAQISVPSVCRWSGIDIKPLYPGFELTSQILVYINCLNKYKVFSDLLYAILTSDAQLPMGCIWLYMLSDLKAIISNV